MIYHQFNFTKNGEIINTFQIIQSENFDPDTFPNTIGGFNVEYLGVVEIGS